MPSYLLVSFNDRGLNYWDNFKIMSETRNVNQFMEDIFALKFDGGDDPKERLMQASGLENILNKIEFSKTSFAGRASSAPSTSRRRSLSSACSPTTAQRI